MLISEYDDYMEGKMKLCRQTPTLQCKRHVATDLSLYMLIGRWDFNASRLHIVLNELLVQIFIVVKWAIRIIMRKDVAGQLRRLVLRL